jgi:hypothetical protein
VRSMGLDPAGFKHGLSVSQLNLLQEHLPGVGGSARLVRDDSRIIRKMPCDISRLFMRPRHWRMGMVR